MVKNQYSINRPSGIENDGKFTVSVRRLKDAYTFKNEHPTKKEKSKEKTKVKTTIVGMLVICIAILSMISIQNVAMLLASLMLIITPFIMFYVVIKVMTTGIHENITRYIRPKTFVKKEIEDCFERLTHILNAPIVLNGYKVGRLYQYWDIENSTHEKLMFTLNEEEFDFISYYKESTFEHEAISYYAEMISEMNNDKVIEIYELLNQLAHTKASHEKEISKQQAYQQYCLNDHISENEDEDVESLNQKALRQEIERIESQLKVKQNEHRNKS